MTGLEWQRTVSQGQATQPDAMAACETLVLDGKSDWRLPSRIELLSLVDTTRYRPTIDVDAFPATPTASFVTASRTAYDGTPYFVEFDFGRSIPTQGPAGGAAAYVRCVR